MESGSDQNINSVEKDDLDRVEARIHSINAVAEVQRAIRCDVDLPTVLNIGGFDLERALEKAPGFS
ncbi:MAG: hypothetical protein HQL32_02455 [Planctomycetes bacterium]|nr:hypothetical protein [Planctomycetota bacterium]